MNRLKLKKAMSSIIILLMFFTLCLPALQAVSVNDVIKIQESNETSIIGPRAVMTKWVSVTERYYGTNYDLAPKEVYYSETDYAGIEFRGWIEKSGGSWNVWGRYWLITYSGNVVGTS